MRCTVGSFPLTAISSTYTWFCHYSNYNMKPLSSVRAFFDTLCVLSDRLCPQKSIQISLNASSLGCFSMSGNRTAYTANQQKIFITLYQNENHVTQFILRIILSFTQNQASKRCTTQNVLKCETIKVQFTVCMA